LGKSKSRLGLKSQFERFFVNDSAVFGSDLTWKDWDSIRLVNYCNSVWGTRFNIQIL